MAAENEQRFIRGVDYTVNKPPKEPLTAKRVLKDVLFQLVQWTWALPVNLEGLLLFLYFVGIKKCKWQRFGHAFIVYVPWNQGGLSVGLFIFMKETGGRVWTYNTRIHEYGHTWQCLFLGPLYWPVIAVPSSIWCNLPLFKKLRAKYGISYYSLYCEKWANAWGQKYSGLQQTLVKKTVKQSLAEYKKRHSNKN